MWKSTTYLYFNIILKNLLYWFRSDYQPKLIKLVYWSECFRKINFKDIINSFMTEVFFILQKLSKSMDWFLYDRDP